MASVYRECEQAGCPFFETEKCAPKNAPMPSLSRIGLAFVNKYMQINTNINHDYR